MVYENDERMRRPYDTTTLIQMLFDQIEEATGLYNDACKDW